MLQSAFDNDHITYCARMVLTVSITDFPKYEDAPLSLLQLDGNCGPITVWALLKYFRKRASSISIVNACRHTKNHGTFTISMAVALREFGLTVRFYTEEDPTPNPIEERCYKLAYKLGVSINSSTDVKYLCSQISDHTVPVVFYDTSEGIGHFSPFLGINDGHLILPYDQNQKMKVSDFQKRWNASGIYKQCLIVS
jgi:hypothetical protein